MKLSLARQLGEDRRQLLWGNDGGICKKLELLDVDGSVRHRSCAGLGWDRGRGGRPTVRMVRSDRLVMAVLKSFCDAMARGKGTGYTGNER